MESGERQDKPVPDDSAASRLTSPDGNLAPSLPEPRGGQPDANETVTAKDLLLSAVSTFMTREKFVCEVTTAALVDVFVALASYREEGVSFYPRVFVCADVSDLASPILASDVTQVGKGDLAKETVRRALKECTPLAEGAWAVYVERKSDGYRYGVLRLPSLPLSLPPSEGMKGIGSAAILLQQLAEGVVQFNGSQGTSLRLHLNQADRSDPSPQAAIDQLCACITEDLSGADRDNAVAFFQRTITRILQTGHGALVAVCRYGTAVPSLLNDGVILESPLDMAERVRNFATDKSATSAFALQGVATLLRGMMGSDGITVMDTKGRILGFRSFVRYGETLGATGGGRRRAFQSVCESGQFRGAMYRSQDGLTLFKRGASE